MMETGGGEQITRLLGQWRNGDHKAFELLQKLVHKKLRGIAHNKLNEEMRSSGLNTTELVQEAYVALLGKREEVDWANRQHFFRIAGLVMRRILVDEARKRQAVKRGGDLMEMDLEEDRIPLNFDPDTVVLIDEALEDLGKNDPELVKLIELRFFVGYSIKRTAEILGMPIIRANRMWKVAKAYLYEFLDGRNLEP